jgi:hypothetical protein
MSENGTVAATEENTSSAAETTNQDAATAQTPEQSQENAPAESPEATEDISYHTVEKEGNVTAIWEMQGRKHIRTIDPRSNEGKQILELFETAG